jgi:hypothetical protein
MELLHALQVGGDLRLQVVDVLGDVAHRVGCRGEEVRELSLAEPALVHELEVVDIDPLLLDGARVGRHGARRDAAHVGVVAA